jgi:hypothetical protein
MHSDQLISSLQDSLASLIRWLVSDELVMTSAISGLTLSGSSAQHGPGGLWQRTYAGYLAQTMDGFTGPSSMTWTHWGTVSAGRYTGLARLARPISANESSSWPTPTVIDSGSGRVNKSDYVDAPERPTLAMMARKGMWPTPVVPNGGRSPKNGMSLTGQTPDGKKRQVDLNYAVKHWPTPAAQDGQNSTLPPSQQERATLPGARLRLAAWPTPNTGDAKGGCATQTNQVQLCAVAAPQPGQNLNPAWVETLMGFPPGWTDVGPQVRVARKRSGSRRAPSRAERSRIERTD